MSTYFALMDIPGLEDTQMVDGSEMTLRQIRKQYNHVKAVLPSRFYNRILRTIIKPTDDLHTESVWNLLKLFLL